ncbi:MAG TPA: ABC transporter ATP-binding protein [Terriglobales bacterium]|nr:ABC transporter ATP-binding protein [Candidatus Acidoferrum sp.]HTW56491.1 ABC transporter ATP-binding protein [Terriglobales bacterium]
MIHLDNVTKQYDLPSGKVGEIVATDRLTLDVPTGEVFGLVGPNGAGKTTTLKMICGLQAPTSGQVTVNGIDVQKQPERAQGYMGYLADFFSLYDDLKVWEYLDYFAHAYKMDPAVIPSRVDEVIRLMNLESKRDELISGLSRGMKQRLGIGRAIIHDPPLLVLDEPAAGLDPKARVELKELLKNLHAEGKTIFITSHILADLEEICTSIAIMEKGQLLRIGKLEDVMREGQSVRRFRIRLADDGFALAEWLGARAELADVTGDAEGAQFAFAGDDAELASMVRELVTAGAAVCGVEEMTETLERLYSRVSSGDVM